MTASISFSDGSEGRLERLFTKKLQREEVRFSWWRNGKMLLRPLDVTEAELLRLLTSGIKRDVFTERFLITLREHLETR